MTLGIIRANNPCALRPHPGEGWRGSSGVILLPGGSYQRFASMAWGMRAALRNLHTYRMRHRLHSAAEIIDRWAPAFENPTSAYAANVARWIGIGRRDPIPFDYTHNRRLLLAIIRQETGGQYRPRASDIAGAFSLMVKEERAAGRDPSPYIAPVTRPLERGVQEAKRIPRRWWAGIAAGVSAALTQARDRVTEFCFWALQECREAFDALARIDPRWLLAGCAFAIAAALYWLSLKKDKTLETDLSAQDQNRHPDAAVGRIDADIIRRDAPRPARRRAQSLDAAAGYRRDTRGFDLLRH